MAATSDERREMAEQLRKHNGRYYEELVNMSDSDLADLIDPTCEMVVKNGHACCGKCGHRLAGECEVEEDYYEFRPFCPDCGARVVSNDD